MVSVIPSERSSLDVIGGLIGKQLSDNLPGAVSQGYNRGLLQNSLEQVKNLASNPNASPLDISLAVMKAGAGIPGSERYMASILPQILELTSARRSQATKQAGDELPGATQSSPRSPIETPQRNDLPNFMNKPKGSATEQFFPTNFGPQGGPGNAPQPSSTGKKIPVPTPQQQIQEAKDISVSRTNAGIPTSVKEAMGEVQDNVTRINEHNKLVDFDTENRQKSQQAYGNKAVDELEKVFTKSIDDKGNRTVDPIVSSEMKAIFKKKGEEASRSGDSEAEIERYLAKEAEKMKNKIVNIRSSLSAPRIQNTLQRAARGDYKTFDNAAKDVRQHLDFLVDNGLYGTARELLTDLNYGPEEREMIIHPLNMQSQSIINGIPNTKYQTTGIPTALPGVNKNVAIATPDEIKNAIMELKKTDSNFSPLLARKAIEDKGYDWRQFKNIWDEMLENGQLELDDDQRDMQGYLDTPPLNLLDSFLEKMNIIGR